MRTIDATAIEPFIREALPLATDAEVAAHMDRLDGRVAHPDEVERVRPGQLRPQT